MFFPVALFSIYISNEVFNCLRRLPVDTSLMIVNHPSGLSLNYFLIEEGSAFLQQCEKAVRSKATSDISKESMVCTLNLWKDLKDHFYGQLKSCIKKHFCNMSLWYLTLLWSFMKDIISTFPWQRLYRSVSLTSVEIFWHILLLSSHFIIKETYYGKYFYYVWNL